MATRELKPGHRAPAFKAPVQGGGTLSLKDLAGSWVVLYFYPKDHTSGCTREAEAFQAAKGKFTRLGAKIVGVSKDTVKSHDGFAAKHKLTFALAADPEKKIHERYGVLKEKKMYGRTTIGTERSTFLIDPGGRIRRIWRKVKVAGHVDEVYEALKAARKE